MTEWEMPEWMKSFAGNYIPEQQISERHMNDHTSNVFTNAPLAMTVVVTKERIQLLQKLYDNELLKF